MGVHVPLIAGIMPILNVAQIKRFISMCGAKIPHPLLQKIEAVEADPEAVYAAGVEYAIRQCHDLPGKRLFEYIDESGDVRPVSSADVNDYIREASGGGFTAKDYRTWAATLGAALLLCAVEHPGNVRGCKRCIKQVLEQVADRLGHTVTICRTSYVHPQLLEDFTENRLAHSLARQIPRRVRRPDPSEPITIDALRAIEPVVARYLDPRKRAHA